MNEIWAKLLNSDHILIDMCDGSDRFIIDHEHPRFAAVRDAMEVPVPLSAVPLDDLIDRIVLTGPVDGKAFLDELDSRRQVDPQIMEQIGFQEMLKPDGTEDRDLCNKIVAELIVSARGSSRPRTSYERH